MFLRAVHVMYLESFGRGACQCRMNLLFTGDTGRSHCAHQSEGFYTAGVVSYEYTLFCDDLQPLIWVVQGTDSVLDARPARRAQWHRNRLAVVYTLPSGAPYCKHSAYARPNLRLLRVFFFVALLGTLGVEPGGPEDR